MPDSLKGLPFATWNLSAPAYENISGIVFAARWLQLKRLFLKEEFIFILPPVTHSCMVELAIQPVMVDRLLVETLFRNDGRKAVKIKQL